MDIKERAIFGGIFIIIIGIFLVAGTKMKFKILVDPPQDWSPYWVHSWLKYFDELSKKSLKTRRVNANEEKRVF